MQPDRHGLRGIGTKVLRTGKVGIMRLKINENPVNGVIRR
jgi:hypothetical protein